MMKKPDPTHDSITIRFSGQNSHSWIVRQLVDELVKKKWAKRREIEEQFELILATKVHRNAVA
jgi:hypothetical protein